MGAHASPEMQAEQAELHKLAGAASEGPQGAAEVDSELTHAKGCAQVTAASSEAGTDLPASCSASASSLSRSLDSRHACDEGSPCVAGTGALLASSESADPATPKRLPPLPRPPVSPKQSEGAVSPNTSHNYYAGSPLKAHAGAINCKGFATRQELTLSAEGLVIVMVGLPGRGKSFIGRKIEGFLKWQCLRTKTFNVGKYRRDAQGATESGRADFFDHKNAAAAAARHDAASRALQDLISFLNSGGDAGIFDATNSTRERRQMIVDQVQSCGRNYRVFFVEVICDDPYVLNTNFRNKVLHSPDFDGLTLEEAIADLTERVRKYEEAYETIEDDSLSYIKLYNMSSKVLVNRVFGSTAKSLLPYLMAIHIGTRPIWLIRAGQVPAGEKSDAHLTPAGRVFAQKLSAFVRRRTSEYFEGQLPTKPVRVLSSTMPSAVQTVLETLQSSDGFSSLNFKQTSSLNPIDRGRLDGPWFIDLCTDKPPFEELKARDPAFFQSWESNRLHTRFPGGESYFDVMTRAESCLLEIEMSTRPVMCVSHISLLQVVLAYFQGIPLEDAWDISVPEHMLFEVVPTLGGSYSVELISVDDEETC